MSRDDPAYWVLLVIVGVALMIAGVIVLTGKDEHGISCQDRDRIQGEWDRSCHPR